MTLSPKFKVGDHVKWKDKAGINYKGVVEELCPRKDGGDWCHIQAGEVRLFLVASCHLTEAAPKYEFTNATQGTKVNTHPKFKVGDRVKWKNPEGRDFRAEVKGLRDDSSGWRYAMTGGGLWWHESHLSLDVPKFKIGDRVRYFDVPGWVVMQGHADGYYTVEKEGEYHDRVSGDRLSPDVPKPDAEEFSKLAIAKLGKALAEAREQIERLQRISDKLIETCGNLSHRLTEEIGGRHRERVAKEGALAAGSLAKDSLRQIAETLGEESILRERIPALTEHRMEELAAAYKRLNVASELMVCQKEAAQKELANVRKDIADLRTISKRLAL